MFFVGQKVVCIYDGAWGHTVEGGAYVTINENCPVFNQVYTISFILTDPKNDICFHLEEIFTTNVYGYNSSAFRPVVEKGTEAGMEILTKILKTGKISKEKKIKEDV